MSVLLRGVDPEFDFEGGQTLKDWRFNKKTLSESESEIALLSSPNSGTWPTPLATPRDSVSSAAMT